MKPIISDLVSQFEQGRLTRRGLIQSLAMLVTVERAAAADAPVPAAPPLPAAGIDHVSVRVKDLQRLVCVEGRHDLRHAMKVSVDELAQPA